MKPTICIGTEMSRRAAVELAGAVQFGQHDSVAPIGLDPVAGFDRDQRRGNHHATVPEPALRTGEGRSRKVQLRNRSSTDRRVASIVQPACAAPQGRDLYYVKA